MDKKGVSDPYVRVYLVPDEKPSLKRKTRIIKSNLNPIWQETFDYPMVYAEASVKKLIVNLKDQRGLFEKAEQKFMGEVTLVECFSFHLSDCDCFQIFECFFITRCQLSSLRSI